MVQNEQYKLAGVQIGCDGAILRHKELDLIGIRFARPVQRGTADMRMRGQPIGGIENARDDLRRRGRIVPGYVITHCFEIA